MTITTLSSREFNQDTGRAKKASQHGPVFITDRGRPAHVLLTMEEYQRISRKRRNIVERVVGWYKEYRRLGARYEKLAVNYVAMWLTAIMDKSLFRLLPNRA